MCWGSRIKPHPLRTLSWLPVFPELARYLGHRIGNPFVSTDQPVQKHENKDRDANDHANVEQCDDRCCHFFGLGFSSAQSGVIIEETSRYQPAAVQTGMICARGSSCVNGYTPVPAEVNLGKNRPLPLGSKRQAVCEVLCA